MKGICKLAIKFLTKSYDRHLRLKISFEVEGACKGFKKLKSLKHATELFQRSRSRAQRHCSAFGLKLLDEFGLYGLDP